MAKLTKDQKDKLDILLKDKGLYKILNQVLVENGLGDLEIKQLNIGPKKPEIQPQYDAIKICIHGSPMREVCTFGGGCRWVCDH